MLSKLSHIIFLTLISLCFSLHTEARFLSNSDINESLEYILKAKRQFAENKADSVRATFAGFFNLVETHPKKYPFDDWADSCYQLAIDIFRADEYQLLADILDPLYNLSPEIKENRFYGEMGKLINILALSYKNMGFVTESIPIYMKALENLRLCNTLPKRTLPEFYTNLGNALRNLGDLSLADNYYQEALRLFNNQLEDKTLDEETRKFLLGRKTNLLNSIGLSLQSLGKHREAIEAFTRGMNIPGPINLAYIPRYNSNMGVSYQALGEKDTAAYYYTKAINAFENKTLNSSWVRYSLNYSDLLINWSESKLPEAENIVDNVIRVIPEIDDVTIDQIATAYYQKGMICVKRNNFEEAIQYYDKGIYSLTGKTEKKTHYSVLPDINLENNASQVIDGINFRARLLMDWGKTLKNDSSKYKLALQTYELAEICIDSLRATLEGEESKINLSRLAKETYSEKLDLLWNIYSTSGDPGLPGRAFQTMENGKASGIWNLINLSETKSRSLPPELLKKEKSLKEDIAEYNNQILNLELSGSLITKQLDSLKQGLFRLNSELDSLMVYINENYHDFREEKYRKEVFNLQEIRDMLHYDQVMVQYYFSEDYVHQMLIKKDKVIYRAIEEPEVLRGKAEELIDMMHLNHYNYSNNDVIEYNELAWYMYETLILPFEDNVRDNKLIILPDDLLSLLPFEALVYSHNIQPEDDFGDLKYLLQKNEISYAYNAALWAFDRGNHTGARKTIMAFAPSYNVKALDTSQAWSQWRYSLPELPGTYKEVQLLRKKYRARQFVKGKSTEKMFKENAGKYKILHLAMHTILNDESPENSFLAFTPLSDKEEDGKLYANEIRTLGLNSSLTILSACNSGTGEIAAGEGVLSLSRMFILGGASSVIMTLWSVDDQASEELISEFYKDLSIGLTVSEALKSSKIDFLRKAGKLESHPYFWAGFIQLGKDMKIDIDPYRLSWPFMAGGIILLILLFTGIVIKIAKSRR